MNLKALITTFVLGSSSMASADSISLSGSVSVSLGGSATTHTHAHAPAAVYRPAPSVPARPVVVVADPDCHDPAPAPVYHPAPAPVVYQPAPSLPVWQAPYYRITNFKGNANGGTYTGTLGVSKIKMRSLTNARWSSRMMSRRPLVQSQAWFDLTEATALQGKREFFKIGADNGLFSKLQLQALGNGSTRIEQVLVEYADHHGTKQSQVFKLKTSINRAHPSITLDLDGEFRAIHRIVVYGATDAGSAYKIMAK